MNWPIFFTTFITLFVAELGDKTQFAAMALASKEEATWSVLAGVVLALSLAGTLGVFFGKILGNVLDPLWMKWISGSLFILIGLWTFLSPSSPS